MRKNEKSKDEGFGQLPVPSDDKLKSKRSLKQAAKVKEESEKERCVSIKDDDIFAYSGHNDYSSINR